MTAKPGETIRVSIDSWRGLMCWREPVNRSMTMSWSNWRMSLKKRTPIWKSYDRCGAGSPCRGVVARAGMTFPSLYLSSKESAKDYAVYDSKKRTDPVTLSQQLESLAVHNPNKLSMTTGPPTGLLIAQAQHFLETQLLKSALEHRSHPLPFTCQPWVHMDDSKISNFKWWILFFTAKHIGWLQLSIAFPCFPGSNSNRLATFFTTVAPIRLKGEVFAECLPGLKFNSPKFLLFIFFKNYPPKKKTKVEFCVFYYLKRSFFIFCRRGSKSFDPLRF